MHRKVNCRKSHRYQHRLNEQVTELWSFRVRLHDSIFAFIRKGEKEKKARRGRSMLLEAVNKQPGGNNGTKYVARGLRRLGGVAYRARSWCAHDCSSSPCTSPCLRISGSAGARLLFVGWYREGSRRNTLVYKPASGSRSTVPAVFLRALASPGGTSFVYVRVNEASAFRWR